MLKQERSEAYILDIFWDASLVVARRKWLPNGDWGMAT